MMILVYATLIFRKNAPINSSNNFPPVFPNRLLQKDLQSGNENTCKCDPPADLCGHSRAAFVRACRRARARATAQGSFLAVLDENPGFTLVDGHCEVSGTVGGERLASESVNDIGGSGPSGRRRVDRNRGVGSGRTAVRENRHKGLLGNEKSTLRGGRDSHLTQKVSQTPE